jgi:two-component system heavy metal sensor histidine kinase CusS
MTRTARVAPIIRNAMASLNGSSARARLAQLTHAMRSVSLEAQLSLLVALVMVGLLSVVGAHLHYSIKRALQERETREMQGKIELLRHIARRTRSEQDIARDPHSFYEPMIGHAEIAATVYGSDGELLWSSSQRAPVALAPTRIAGPEELPEVKYAEDIVNGRVRHLRTATFAAPLHDPAAHPLTVLLELDITESDAALTRHTETLLVTLLIAGLVGAIVARAAVRIVLRQVAVFGEALRTLSVERFKERIALESIPPELRLQGIAYNAMVERIENAFRRMEAFASDIAHELRTPINNLLLNSQIALSRQRTADDYRATLERNMEEFERLSRMVDNMLFLARVDNARLALRRESVSLRAEAEKVTSFFEAVADEKEVRIETHGDATAMVDRPLVQRVLGNLLSNAIRHSPAGGVVRVEVKVRDDECVEVTVANNGEGIASEDLPHVFERFYRGDPARTLASEGAGLGLAIVKSIVELHGGEVGVRSTTEDGTIFSLSFPG